MVKFIQQNQKIVLTDKAKYYHWQKAHIVLYAKVFYVNYLIIDILKENYIKYLYTTPHKKTIDSSL